MSFEVYDYRSVNRNVLVTPEIRARLYHMAPGQVDGRHSHDLGHEVFLILEGRAEFNIGGVTRQLGPGELCIARADEIHQVRNLLPDQPTIMYLSVTPHVQPTHTGRGDDDAKLPPRFQPNASYHVEQAEAVTLGALLARQVRAAEALLAAAEANLATQRAEAARLGKARAAGDEAAAGVARDTMWQAVYGLHKRLYEFDAIWNEVAPRAAQDL